MFRSLLVAVYCVLVGVIMPFAGMGSLGCGLILLFVGVPVLVMPGGTRLGDRVKLSLPATLYMSAGLMINREVFHLVSLDPSDAGDMADVALFMLVCQACLFVVWIPLYLLDVGRP